MKGILLLSDVHLEFRQNYQIKDGGDILVLAGDIGAPKLPSYKQFLLECKKNFKEVLVLPGNHEYYGAKYTMTQYEEIIKDICTETKCLYLNKQVHKIYGITFIGATLWTKIPPECAKTVENKMNDYRSIRIGVKEMFSARQCNELHEDHRKFIIDELSKVNEDEKVVVVTHHLPSKQLIDDKYKIDLYKDINCAYASNCEDIMKSSLNIKAWLCGHSHSIISKTIEDVPCYINCVGYLSEGLDPIVDKPTLFL